MAKIVEISSYLPEGKLTNEELSKRFEKWTSEKIYEKTGIKERRIAKKNQTAADLAILAAEKLFQTSKIKRSEIDFLIFVSQTQNQCLPSSSCEIHESLNLRKSCGAFDINQGCSGYIYGLNICASIIDSGHAKNILLLTGDTYSKIIEGNDASVLTLFGDGASATLISSNFNEGFQINKFLFGTDGSGAKYLKCDFGGFKKSKEEWELLKMDGARVMQFTLSKIPEIINNYFELTKSDLSVYDKVVLHQANKFILKQLYKKINAEEKGVISLKTVGNTVSSSIPIALEKLLEDQDKISNILLVGFGVGLSWGITSINR
tara:strand:+ start:3794 stop:4750 length:957 start_codon:yes stop_codon:yes gene_type:complete